MYARMVRGSNKVSVSGMVIGDCEGCGLKAEMAQGVTMEACEVVSAGGDGVAYRGATGTVTRVKVVRSGRHGCLCDRGRLEVADCEVADSEGNGLHAMPGALLLHGGTTLSGNKAGNVGIAPRLGLCSLYRKGKIKKLK